MGVCQLPTFIWGAKSSYHTCIFLLIDILRIYMYLIGHHDEKLRIIDWLADLFGWITEKNEKQNSDKSSFLPWHLADCLTSRCRAIMMSSFTGGHPHPSSVNPFSGPWSVLNCPPLLRAEPVTFCCFWRYVANTRKSEKGYLCWNTSFRSGWRLSC